MKYLLLFSWILNCTIVTAQRRYTTANAHAHNDYEHAHPFFTAYENRFGSVEVDIFLYNDSLLVGHTSADLALHRSLQALYLDPLKQEIEKHDGYPYSDTALGLQLLIDLKTEGIATLDKLIRVLGYYPSLTQCHRVRIVITGNRPPEKLFTRYPAWISFDGELHLKYSTEALTRILMLSDDFTRYSHWNGQGSLMREDLFLLQTAIMQAHRSGKNVRFWNAPDSSDAWKEFMSLDVDYINTDHIPEMTAFMKAIPK